MGLKKLAKSAVKSVSKTVSGATKSLSNLAENTVKTVGDIGTTAYKGAGNLAENVVKESAKGIGDLSTNVYKETGNVLQSAGSELGKGAIDLVTSGEAKRLTKATASAGEDFGEAVSDAGHWVDDNKGLIAGATIGALTGGTGLALLGGLGLGATMGKSLVDDPSKEKFEKKVAEAKANTLARESAMMSKQSMLANELSMTARRAMAKRAAANLRKNTSTPASQFLGGEQQTLG